MTSFSSTYTGPGLRHARNTQRRTRYGAVSVDADRLLQLPSTLILGVSVVQVSLWQRVSSTMWRRPVTTRSRVVTATVGGYEAGQTERRGPVAKIAVNSHSLLNPAARSGGQRRRRRSATWRSTPTTGPSDWVRPRTGLVLGDRATPLEIRRDQMTTMICRPLLGATSARSPPGFGTSRRPCASASYLEQECALGPLRRLGDGAWEVADQGSAWR